ncbi:uncharacterized protein LOC115728005 [Rhodamnia argentea]|uniref:Uncharacterized protein LOC115728005 n=1 Tax=Rhodamnia argentea TaxID=178133 RepID=A0A8B8MVR1_9MYRT|nr:uncharacterized protein LOC115728005 [Rhodamnia argentea]
MDCTVCTPITENFLSKKIGELGGGFSHESEHDLAVMVSEFLENGASGGAESWCSSDSDSGLCDLAQLADNITFSKCNLDQYESDLQSVVHSLVLSINEIDLQFVKSGPCNASCIRFSLVQLLRHSGYDAAVCSSRWQGGGKVPGGDHEYIDVVNHTGSGNSDRLIIDIDFQSHFEIARAVESYDRILKLLPVIYVGSLGRLSQFLQVMAEAGRFSLKQNSMPLPPWRSLAYLQAKWHSPYQRQFDAEKQSGIGRSLSEHKQCSGHLKRLQLALVSQMEADRLLKPKSGNNKNRRLKVDRRWHSLFRTR